MPERLKERLSRQISWRLAKVLNPLIPGSSLQFGPPRGYVASFEGWLKSRGAAEQSRRIEVYAEKTFQRCTPKTLETAPPRVLREAIYETTPSMGVYVIDSGRVIGREAAIVTPDDKVLLDLSLHFAPYHFEVYQEWKKRPPVKAGGPVLVLAGLPGDNYGHWLHQMLPRAQLATKAGFSHSDWAAVVINDSRGKFTFDSAEAVGIPREKCVPASSGLHLTGNPLVVPDFVPAGNPPAWACNYLRDMVRQPATGKRRRIFATRRACRWRRLSNEAEIDAVLQSFGFETIEMDRMPFLESVRIFQEAEAVCGVHGANLSNILFCEPGAKLIEIYHPGHPEAYFWTVASESSLEYYYVLGEGERRDEPDLTPHGIYNHSDITLDPQKLRDTLVLAGL